MRVPVGTGLALALALAAVAVSAGYPAPWNPALTPEQQQRVDNYTPRFPHSPTPRGNPCRAVCASSEAAAASEQCITCCRTARHRVPWNCAAPSGAHGDANPTRDAHNGVPTKCCTEWSAECWDRPSADNYEHSCDMCSQYNYNATAVGCDRQWTTAACWDFGVPPANGGAYVYVPGAVFVPGSYQTPIPSGMTNTFFLYGGTNITLAPGAVLAAYQVKFQESLTAPALITALGTGLQFAAYYTQYDVVSNPNPYFVLAPRNAIIDLGDLQNGPGTIRIDNTYDPTVIGATPPPAGPPAPQVRYLKPRYHSTVLAWWSHSPFASTTRLEVVGDSGLVTIAYSTPNDGTNRLPFRSTVKVDGTYGAKLQLTGQAAGWYPSLPNAGQAYAPFIAGTQSSPMAVTLANGGAISFANYTELDVVTFAVTGTAPVFVEFLRGANVSDGVDLSGLNGAPAGSAVVLDGLTTLSASANLGTANRFTCGGAGCYSGTTPQGGVCLPAVSTCTGTACAGACSCTPSTTTLFASAYSPTAMCSFASCASPCLGGSTCAGANTCTAACPATATAHFSANCQAQDGTCATPCATGTCGAGGVCPGDSSSTGWSSNDAVARAKISPVAVAALAMAAALMLRN